MSVTVRDPIAGDIVFQDNVPRETMRQEVLRQRQQVQASREADMPGFLGRTLIGTGRGFKTAFKGAQQLAGEGLEELGLLPQGATETAITRPAQAEMREFAATPVGQTTSSAIGEFIGEAAPFAVVPGGIGGGLLRRAGTGAVAGIPVGAAQFVPADTDQTQARLQGAALGGIGGAAAPIALAGLGVGARKGLEAIRGKGERAAEALDLGQQFDVPVFAPDVKGGLSRRLSILSEQVPLGLRGPRIKQNVKMKEAASQLLSVEEQKLFKGQFTGLDEITKIAEGQSKRAPEARRLLQNIEQSSQDWRDIIKTSGNVNLFKRKLASDRLYENADALIPEGKGVVPQNTIKSIDEFLKQELASGLPDQTVIGLMQRVKTSLTPEVGEPRQLNFNDLQQLRSRILANIRDQKSRATNKLVGSRGVAALSNLEDAIQKDMTTLAGEVGGEAKAAYQAANKFYKENVVPFKERQIEKLFSEEGDPDKIFQAFIKRTGTRKDAKKFFDALDPKGQQAVRYGMLQDAMNRSLRTVENRQVFSNAQFRKALDDFEVGREFFFDKKTKTELDGFRKLLDLTERSAQTAEFPPTGGRNVQALLAGVGGASLFNQTALSTLAATIGTTAGMRVLWTTAPGQKILARVARAKPSSPAFNKAVNDATLLMNTAAQRAAPVASSQLGIPEPETQEER